MLMSKIRNQKQNGQAVVEMCFSMIMFTAMISLISTLCLFLYMQSNVITAAREGARIAASDPNFKTGATTTAVTDVRDRVTQYFTQTTGQTIPAANITVTSPSGTVGFRNTTVTVNFTVNNPIPIAGFLTALGAPSSSTSGLGTIALTSTASARYEE